MRLIDADALLAELNVINAPYRADINNWEDHATNAKSGIVTAVITSGRKERASDEI